ncbi:MAG: flavin reductase [Clostridia bacterium]|nr:flavin reductase [Clostridia bacterium]
MDNTALFKLSYGLFVLTSSDTDKNNGCIINTCMQITDNPKQICVCVNKANYSAELISKTGIFTISILTTDTPFSVFERFGFQSGRNTDKFEGFDSYTLADNGLPYLTKYCNAFISAKVTQEIDCGSHLMFIAEVTEAVKFSDEPSVTYEYYFANIKPKPQAPKKKGFVCKICGYVHEAEELPPDFVCPWCKHGADDFEPIQ